MMEALKYKLPDVYYLYTQEDLGAFNCGERAISTPSIRASLSPRVFSLPLVRAIGKTMVQGKNYGPQITVKRIAGSR